MQRAETAAAAELGRVDLRSALGICLVFLEAEPASYEPAAVKWLGRLLSEHPARLAPRDAELTAASLGALRVPGRAEAGAEALAELLVVRCPAELARPLR